MASNIPGGCEILRPIKWYKSLTERHGRDQAGAFLIEGRRAIEQIRGHSPGSILEILLDENNTSFDAGRTPVSHFSLPQFRSIAASQHPQGVAAVVAMPSGAFGHTLPSRPGARIVLLDDIQDPGNAGTLIRTAAALGFDGMLMTEKCADPFAPKCVQASAGTILSLWIRRTPACTSLLLELVQNGSRLIAADCAGQSPENIDTKGNVVLALGNEGNGLSRYYRDMASQIIHIPIDTVKAESLNVAAAGAICMFVITRGH
jgi:TrmH family RNA methyltransferase